jgi:hypothetical protein
MKSSENKKYRHGIEVKKQRKPKIKKQDLLQRIEQIEAKLNALGVGLDNIDKS